MHKRNIRLTIAYDGTRYLGWQRLGGNHKELSIQGLIERCISNVINENIKIQGSGRTDAGVHAFSQVANFITTSEKQCKDIMSECNKLLPDDIAILNVEDMKIQFHSRYSATGKIYEYYIDDGIREDVFNRKYAYHVEKCLDLDSMREAAQFLIGTHDFTSFSTDRVNTKNMSKVTRGHIEIDKDTIRTLYSICIERVPGIIGLPIRNNQNLVRIQLHGEGFLYNMVRIIVGSLIEVGMNDKQASYVKYVLEQKNRQLAGPTVPPHGLFLKEVMYEKA